MKTSERITYKELADRLDSIYLFNKAPELDENLWDNLENGELEYMCDCIQCDDRPDDEKEMISEEIFQWYLIGKNDAEYLMRHTDEIIFYSDVLDEYIWGVTHWGTPWEGVELEFKDAKA